MTLSYTADDPWIVVLVSASRRFRYLVVVRPDGTVADAKRTKIGWLERLRGVKIQIPGGTDAERDAARRRKGSAEAS